MIEEKRPLRRLIATFPHRWKLMLGVFVTVLMSVLTVAVSYVIMQIIDAALDGDRTLFVQSFALLMAVVLFNVVSVYLRTRTLGRYTEHGMLALREEFALKSVDISLSSHQASHSGDLLSRGTNDTSRVRQFASNTLPRMIEIPLTAVIALVVLFILSWRLTLITMAMIPVLIIGSALLSKPIGPASKRVQQKLGNVNAVVTDFIKGVEVSKAYNLEATLERKNRTYVDESVESGIELAKRRSILEAFSMVISIVPFAGTFLIGGYFVIEDHMTVGGLLAFINLLNLLTFPLSQMAIIIGEAKKDMASANRIFETLDAAEERKDGEVFEFDSEGLIIKADDLHFSYNGDEHNVINALSLDIEEGKTVAFVGPSGGGKSTLAKLLMGFYDNYEGSLCIGGHEIKDWSLEALRKNMALVSQDTFLFPESICENIAHGNPAATFEEIKEAAQKANAHEFIMALPSGYDTVLSELGHSLSGGQRQRLSIARAILKDAPILVLDEATSALDTDSEAIIQEALEPVIKEKTTLIIAHRLSTIKHADEICVISDGTIVEKGDHETLLEKEGTYARLYENERDEERKMDDEKTDF